MMYTRAAASDYDDWEKNFDNPGWGSKDLIPLLKKVSVLYTTVTFGARRFKALTLERNYRRKPTRYSLAKLMYTATRVR